MASVKRFYIATFWENGRVDETHKATRKQAMALARTITSRECQYPQPAAQSAHVSALDASGRNPIQVASFYRDPDAKCPVEVSYRAGQAQADARDKADGFTV